MCIRDSTGTLAKQKVALTEVLEAGPTALSNLQLAFNPSSGTLDTRNNESQLDYPALYLCSLLTGLGEPESSCDQIKKILDRKELVIPGTGGSGGGTGGGGSSEPDLTLGGILGGTP